MSTPNGFDLSTAAAVTQHEDEGQVVPIHHPDGEPALVDGQPVTITVAGLYSKRYREKLDAQRSKAAKRRNPITGEELTRQQVELVAHCTLGWTGFTNGGQPFPHSFANAVELLVKAPWVREQLEEAMADHAGFSKRGSGS
jgi:hypothetical protein